MKLFSPMMMGYHIDHKLCWVAFVTVLGTLAWPGLSFLAMRQRGSSGRGAFVVEDITVVSSTLTRNTDSNDVIESLLPNDDDPPEATIDNRPHEQRTKGPRMARRMNHGFRYLYRTTSHLYENMTAFDYLTQFYSETEVMEMNRTFPPLLDLNVSRHVHPKVRFLQETLLSEDYQNPEEIGVAHDGSSEPLIMNLSGFDIPSQYFGARLEKTVAPSHAFLVHMGLPHGRSLLMRENQDQDHGGKRVGARTKTKWQDFMISCRRTKQFCALCNQWQRENEQNSHDANSHRSQITSKEIEAFYFIFGRGLLAAARGELIQSDNAWPLEHINITSKDVLELLIQHGANPLEKDTRGSTLLHWAAGTGNLEAFETLLPYFPSKFLEKTERDGATPLHWACAGANSKEFGTGGHYGLCQHILSECDRMKRYASNRNKIVPSAKELVNQQTKDGNSPLMWAAWSSSLDTVKLMVRYRAEWDLSNRNGCTVAHWAASGGNLEVCKYLAEVVGVDFFVPNHGGNTPLTHAVAFGRLEVVEWLRELAASEEDDDQDLIAKQLAADFATWRDEQSASDTTQRKKILKLFEDDYWDN